jgi:hypothetical protein
VHDTCRDLHKQDVKAHLDDLVAVRQADSGAKTGRSDLFRNAGRQRLATGRTSFVSVIDAEAVSTGSSPFRLLAWAKAPAGVAAHTAAPRIRLTNKQRFARMTVPPCEKSATNRPWFALHR